jgi:hypothetical protein
VLLSEFRYGRRSKSILGLDTILYDFTSTENNENFRKVGLFKRATGKGAFNKLQECHC